VGLSSPEEELAILLFFPCFDEQNVDINFDDDVSNSHSDIPCPPADGGRYNSLDDLSVFDGSSVNGAWTLIVNDDADDDGGSLNTWSLEVCFLQESLVIALSINADKTDETCFGNNDGTASVNALDGTGNYSFLWSNGATDASIENLAPGTYTVTVSDGVTDIVESMTIAAAAEIVSSFDLSNQSCSDSADGQITAMAADLDYLWPDGSTGTTFNNLVLGSYEVLITDPATGCSATEILEISAPDPILIATAIENVSCAGSGDGSIVATISGGIQPYTINTSDLTFLSAGDYMIPVTDANGCIQSTIATVTEPNPITIDFSASGITRVGATDGAINASASGGNEGYIYNWSNSDTGASISGLAEGTYELTVTDQNGCRKTESTVVAGIECSTISIQLAVDQNTTLNGADGRISASVTGQQASFTYLWSTGATTATITDLPVGTYMVTVTDESGCTGVHTAVLNEVECIPFSILLDIDQITELGGSDGRISASVEGQGTYSYLWSTGATTDAISDLTVGTYSVTVTDERGCTTTQTGVLNEVNCTPFSISFDVVPISIFNGSDASIAVSVDGQGTYTYEWSTGAITDTISDLPEGFYSVTITDDMGCIQVQTLELEGFDCTSFNIDFVTSEPNCRVADGMIAASVVGSNGPFAFKWSTGREGEAITDISSGNYEVTVTDISGCSSVSDIVLTEGNDLTPPTLDCPENRVVTNACNNPVNYDLVANDNCSMVQLELLQGLESGSAFPQGETLVEYMAIDEAGNMATCSFMITNSSDMSLEYDPTFLIPNNDDQILFAFDLKCSDPNEAITNFVSINGGLPPFTFDVFEVSNGGSATIYSVNVTDATGCLIQDQVNFLNINDTEGLISPIVDVVIQDVSTGADGGIAIEVDDRFGIVSFTWTREDTVVSTNQNIENVEAGDYVLELRDEFGCTYTSDYVVQMLTSTNQLLLEETVQLMPNPTTGIFQIQITLPNPIPVSIELYDINGRLLQPVIKQDNTDLPININIGEFAKGIYFTKISAEQEVIVKRVVLL